MTPDYDLATDRSWLQAECKSLTAEVARLRDENARLKRVEENVEHHLADSVIELREENKKLEASLAVKRQTILANHGAVDELRAERDEWRTKAVEMRGSRDEYEAQLAAMNTARAEADALVMSHEGHIAVLEAELVALRTAAEPLRDAAERLFGQCDLPKDHTHYEALEAFDAAFYATKPNAPAENVAQDRDVAQSQLAVLRVVAERVTSNWHDNGRNIMDVAVAIDALRDVLATLTRANDSVKLDALPLEPEEPCGDGDKCPDPNTHAVERIFRERLTANKAFATNHAIRLLSDIARYELGARHPGWTAPPNTTVAWDGSEEEFWRVIGHVKDNDEVESDAAVLSEVLSLAQAQAAMKRPRDTFDPEAIRHLLRVLENEKASHFDIMSAIEDVRDSERLPTTEEGDDIIRQAGGDPEAVGRRGATLVAELTGKRKERKS